MYVNIEATIMKKTFSSGSQFAHTCNPTKLQLHTYPRKYHLFICVITLWNWGSRSSNAMSTKFKSVSSFFRNNGCFSAWPSGEKCFHLDIFNMILNIFTSGQKSTFYGIIVDIVKNKKINDNVPSWSIKKA